MTGKATRSPVPVDCDCEPQRPHGTTHTYNRHRCGCEACRRHRRNTSKRNEVAKARGVTPFVDPAPSRQQLQRLLDSGWSENGIHAATGLARSTIAALLDGSTRSTRPDTAERIGALRPMVRPAADHAASGIEVQRRVQSLQWLGWSFEEIADAGGPAARTVRQIARGQDTFTPRPATTRKVLAAYRTLSTRMSTGPRASRIRGWASTFGYPAPGSWEDPEYVPTAESLTRVDVMAVRLENYDHLTAGGVIPEQAALRAGWPSLAAAERAARRADRRDIATAMQSVLARQRFEEAA